jgi:hypothetical protein
MESIATIRFSANLVPLWYWATCDMDTSGGGHHSCGHRGGICAQSYKEERSAAERHIVFHGESWTVFHCDILDAARHLAPLLHWCFGFYTSQSFHRVLVAGVSFTFSPQLQFFPVSATSIFEMDQIVALLAVVVVTVIRIARPIFQIRPLCSSCSRVRFGLIARRCSFTC